MAIKFTSVVVQLGKAGKPLDDRPANYESVELVTASEEGNPCIAHGFRSEAQAAKALRHYRYAI